MNSRQGLSRSSRSIQALQGTCCWMLSTASAASVPCLSDVKGMHAAVDRSTGWVVSHASLAELCITLCCPRCFNMDWARAAAFFEHTLSTEMQRFLSIVHNASLKQCLWLHQTGSVLVTSRLETRYQIPVFKHLCIASALVVSRVVVVSRVA